MAVVRKCKKEEFDPNFVENCFFFKSPFEQKKIIYGTPKKAYERAYFS